MRIFKFLKKYWFSAALITMTILICLGITWKLIAALSQYSIDGNENLEMDTTGQVGDFLGGVVGTIISFTTLIFLFLTYFSGKQSNERAEIERQFFNLIQIHIDNVNSAEYNNPYDENAKTT